MKKMSVLLLLIGLLVFSMILSGCANKTESNTNSTVSTNSQTTNTPVNVTLGLSKYTSGAPLYIALEKGFFKEFGVNVDLKWFNSAKDMMVALSGGSLDTAGTSLTAALYNQIAAGEKIVVVADKGKEQKGFRYTALVVPNDSNIKSVEDLKGKKIGIQTIGSSDHYVIGRILEKHGMTINDVQWAPLGSLSAQSQALQGKQVDMVKLVEPDVDNAVNNGYGRVLVWLADEIPYQSAAIYFSPKFVTNKDAGVRFLKGYLKGMRYYADAVLVQKDGQYVKGANYDEVIKIIAQYTELPENTVKGGLIYFDRNGTVDVDDVQTQINWYLANNFITESVDAKKDLVNTELLAEAFKQLENNR